MNGTHRHRCGVHDKRHQRKREDVRDFFFAIDTNEPIAYYLPFTPLCVHKNQKKMNLPPPPEEGREERERRRRRRRFATWCCCGSLLIFIAVMTAVIVIPLIILHHKHRCSDDDDDVVDKLARLVGAGRERKLDRF